MSLADVRARQRWPVTAKWSDVIACFSDRRNPLATIHRLSDEWAQHHDIAPRRPRYDENTMVQREWWSNERIDEHLTDLAQIVPALITELKPRWLLGAIVIIDFGAGKIGQIDGRRRANLWRHEKGIYEVLRICAY